MIIVFVWHLAEKSIPKLNLLVTRSSFRSHINLPTFCRMKLLQMNVALLLEMFKARDKCSQDVIYNYFALKPWKRFIFLSQSALAVIPAFANVSIPSLSETRSRVC